jgi:5'-3' exonuclease
MGIPSYFSYIVKNHPEILERFIKGTIPIHNLYMDCNSVIYDSFYNLSDDELGGNIAKILVANVIKKITQYIVTISPTERVIISFDGVAPVAKLEQQRSRRFKSWFQSMISNKIFNTQSGKWSTTAITPGTSFMKQLNKEITQHFKSTKIPNINAEIIVSTSDEVGEGEHKIFHYIRGEPSHKDKHTVIYGLDADLIMLAINHLPLCKNIFLFRETPEFIKSIDSSLEPNDHYLFHISLLATNIVLDMQQTTEFSDMDKNNRLHDYIFLCFLLGNDFLPHFPGLNIRTGGIDKLLQHYKATIGNKQQFLIKNNKIQWKVFNKLVASLADSEHHYIIKEHNIRNGREKNYEEGKISTCETKYEKFQDIPCFERTVEKHINPNKDHWRHRYYTSLFHCEPSEQRIRQICTNYLEGLEWTYKYYNSDCPDWRWKYQYNYPPLLIDLVKHIPYFDTDFIKPNTHEPVEQKVQLCYVLPRHNLSLLPYKLYSHLLTNYSQYYPENADFEWSYCRYFWESHVILPEICIDTLEKIIASN